MANVKRGFRPPGGVTTTIRAMWDQYRTAIYPDPIPDNQRLQLEQAFFSGCYALLASLTEIAHSDNSADHDVNYLLAWKEECERDAAARIRAAGVDET